MFTAKYWELRLFNCKEALEENNFSAFIAYYLWPQTCRHWVGRNKIVSNLEEAMNRIKNFAAPANAIRHGKKTPCVKTTFCMECKSPDRICNVWTIHEKSHPKGRIKVILINQDLGL